MAAAWTGSAGWWKSPAGRASIAIFSDHITGPLGMNDTGFSLSEKQRARQASLHVRDATGKLLPQPLEKPKVPKAFSGGGGIYFHRAGLSDPAAGAGEWWKLSRDKHPPAGEALP